MPCQSFADLHGKSALSDQGLHLDGVGLQPVLFSSVVGHPLHPPTDIEPSELISTFDPGILDHSGEG